MWPFGSTRPAQRFLSHCRQALDSRSPSGLALHDVVMWWASRWLVQNGSGNYDRRCTCIPIFARACTVAFEVRARSLAVKGLQGLFIADASVLPDSAVGDLPCLSGQGAPTSVPLRWAPGSRIEAGHPDAAIRVCSPTRLFLAENSATRCAGE